uniref:Uncharacterized protein n=1 Tax=Rhizophora mucronata TaxID=61149 RepID=A0A2P2QUH4_RHIMU
MIEVLCLTCLHVYKSTFCILLAKVYEVYK